MTGHTDTENEDLHIPGLVVSTELLQGLLEIGNGALWTEMELLAPFLQLGLLHVHTKGRGLAFAKRRGWSMAYREKDRA